MKIGKRNNSSGNSVIKTVGIVVVLAAAAYLTLTYLPMAFNQKADIPHFFEKDENWVSSVAFKAHYLSKFIGASEVSTFPNLVKKTEEYYSQNVNAFDKKEKLMIKSILELMQSYNNGENKMFWSRQAYLNDLKDGQSLLEEPTSKFDMPAQQGQFLYWKHAQAVLTENKKLGARKAAVKRVELFQDQNDGNMLHLSQKNHIERFFIDLQKAKLAGTYTSEDHLFMKLIERKLRAGISIPQESHKNWLDKITAITAFMPEKDTDQIDKEKEEKEKEKEKEKEPKSISDKEKEAKEAKAKAKTAHRLVTPFDVHEADEVKENKLEWIFKMLKNALSKFNKPSTTATTAAATETTTTPKTVETTPKKEIEKTTTLDTGATSTHRFTKHQLKQWSLGHLQSKFLDSQAKSYSKKYIKNCELMTCSGYWKNVGSRIWKLPSSNSN